MTDSVIASKVANALIADVHVRGVGRAAPSGVLNRFQGHYGGLWVGGRLTLTPTSVQFHPNALNRSVQSGSLDIEIGLGEVESVEVLPGVLTKIIALHVGDRLVKFRCFGARKMADQIRAAASTAHGWA